MPSVKNKEPRAGQAKPSLMYSLQWDRFGEGRGCRGGERIRIELAVMGQVIGQGEERRGACRISRTQLLLILLGHRSHSSESYGYPQTTSPKGLGLCRGTLRLSSS